MPRHRIQLRGPWTVVDPLGTARSVTMPQAWQVLFGGQTGTARFERWFHRPTNLVAADQLAIVLTGVAGVGVVALNGQLLGEIRAPEQRPAASPIASADAVLEGRGDPMAGEYWFPLAVDRLQSRNCLQIELSWFGPSTLAAAVAGRSNPDDSAEGERPPKQSLRGDAALEATKSVGAPAAKAGDVAEAPGGLFGVVLIQIDSAT